MNTENYSKVRELINNADALLIGAGAGLSTSAGVNYGSELFADNFPELVKHYNFTDMYTSSFYPFKTEEERWSYWAKHINYLCLSMEATEVYKKLFNLVKDKNYFVITTNVDKQFIKSGFDEKKVFEIQGTLTKIQCAKACHNTLYDDVELVREMLEKNKDIKIPCELVPKCPKCGESMEVNLRKDNFFVEDKHWHKMNRLYEQFINDNKNKNIAFIELGAGFNTPGIIRYPFEELTYNLPKAHLVRINKGFADIPEYLKNKSIGINEDIGEFLENI